MGRKKREAFFLPGVGYLREEEKEFLMREAAKVAPLIAAGLPLEEAKEHLLRRLREYRAAKEFFAGKAKKK